MQQIDVDINQTADNLLAYLCSHSNDFNVKDCCFKTLNEDSYIFGRRKLVEFAYIHEKICSNSVPNLVLVRVNSVEVEKVGDSVYVMLDKDMQSCSNSDPTTPSQDSVETPTNLDFFRQNSLVTFAAEIKQQFAVFVEYVNLALYLSNAQVSVSPASIGIQLGLFHGVKRLCPTVTQFLKVSSQNGTIFSVQKVRQFMYTQVSIYTPVKMVSLARP